MWYLRASARELLHICYCNYSTSRRRHCSFFFQNRLSGAHFKRHLRKIISVTGPCTIDQFCYIECLKVYQKFHGVNNHQNWTDINVFSVGALARSLSEIVAYLAFCGRGRLENGHHSPFINKSPVMKSRNIT